MGTCLDRGIKVVTNAGGLDPAGCAEAVQEVADRLGLAPRIAYVDRRRPAGPARRARRRRSPAGPPRHRRAARRPPAPPRSRANAYLGCWGIVEALGAGADIVITGRVTDAAIVMAPAAHVHGWARDRLGPAGRRRASPGTSSSAARRPPAATTPSSPRSPTCATPASRSPRSRPTARRVITKHPGTGGRVDVGTVTSQLLYEIGSAALPQPRRRGPLRHHRARATTDRDRVRIGAVRGEPRAADAEGRRSTTSAATATRSRSR